MRKNLGCSLWTASFFGRASFYSERWLLDGVILFWMLDGGLIPGTILEGWTILERPHSILDAGRSLNGFILRWTMDSLILRWTIIERPHSILDGLILR